MAKELDLPPDPKIERLERDKKRAKQLMQGQPRDPISGLGKALKVLGYDLPKDIYERITETGKYASKPKPKNTRSPNKPSTTSSKSYSNTTRKAKYKD